MTDQEKLKIINESFGTDLASAELDGLEDKIINNLPMSDLDNTDNYFVAIYSSISFLDTDDLHEYVNICLNDCCDPEGPNNIIELSDIYTKIRLDDDVYIISNNERIANYTKKWIEKNYPDKTVYIAENENAIPPSNVEIRQSCTYEPQPEIPSKYKRKMDFTNNSYFIIASLDTGDENTMKTTEEQAKAIKFFTSHKVMLIDTYEQDKKLPDNIAIVIGNDRDEYTSIEYNNIVDDLFDMNYSITHLLINFTIKTHHPNLFNRIRDNTIEYINQRYGDNGILVRFHIEDAPEDADHPENVYFELDMKSNIPTTIIHSDIQAYVGSYCLNIEFEYNHKRK